MVRTAQRDPAKAYARLAAMGVELDALSPGQQAYLSSWRATG